MRIPSAIAILLCASLAQAADEGVARGLLEGLLLPGVSIAQVKVSDTEVEFDGRSSSNTVLSDYLRMLNGSPQLERPELLEIAAEGGQYRYAIRVSMPCLANASCPAPAQPKRQSVYKCTVNGVTTFQAQPCPE
ncbi:MAG: PilN domain-containing protein [Rhodanobacteraceae bacterium]|nr:PilN domain-containing protein [Rhodanobacteraceae bacterium]